MRVPHRITRATRGTLTLVVCAWFFHTCSVQAGQHPRLLITPEDIPRLRHACGVGAATAHGQGRGRFGEKAAAFNTLRSYFTRRLGDIVLAGELPAAAFLHLLDPDDPHDQARLDAVNYALTQPVIMTANTLELVLALDWCWEALDPPARTEFLLQMRRDAKPLTATDSPLDHRVFRQKLAVLALALAVDESDHPSPSWAAFRQRILKAARQYFLSTFPTYVQWRGLIPTSPSVAALEENDTALAVELAGLLTGTDAWKQYRDSVGRWMEHYVVVASAHPALQHQFLRDDGSTAPLMPVTKWEGLLPLTAHLIAARTHDPAAAHIADQVANAVRLSSDSLVHVWRWLPVVFDLRGVSRVDVSHLPLARHLDGAVVLRGDAGPNAAVIWIDAGQPFLHHGQHFDAGHFLLRAGGHLAVSGADEIELEATYSKGGQQRLGKQRGTFDFAQYCTSTIAHNCMIFWDDSRVPRWHGRLYLPKGGQLPREGTCTDFLTSLEAQARLTGRLLAYGHQEATAYAALDLAPAYDPRSVRSYTREFVFLWGRVLLVIDRANTTSARVTPTWVINVPTSPRVDGQDLTSAARTAGTSDGAGVWRYDEAAWLHWRDRDGSLWFRSVLPEPRRLAIVGGPARKLVIPEGAHQGRSYVGGDPDSFERLILPSSRPNAANAWYRLGRPTLLGPQFAQRPHWGRVEVAPLQPGQQHLFVSGLVIGAGDAPEKPDISVQETNRGITIGIRLAGKLARIVVPAGEGIGGEVQIESPAACRWTLPGVVTVDKRLPVR